MVGRGKLALFNGMWSDIFVKCPYIVEDQLLDYVNIDKVDLINN